MSWMCLEKAITVQQPGRGYIRLFMVCCNLCIESVLAYIPFGPCLLTIRCFLMNEQETGLV